MSNKNYTTGTFLYNAAPQIFNLNQNLGALGLSAPDDIPKEFDWRKELQLAPVFNQNPCQCGGCWALSSTGAFADRVRIKSKIDDAIFEPIELIQCLQGQSQGCQGGFPLEAGKFLERNGSILLSESNVNCMPFNNYCRPSQTLETSCQQIKQLCGKNKSVKAVENGTHTIVKKGNDNRVDRLATVQAIQAEVLADGPVVAAYMVYDDFVASDWKSTNGIYINGAYNEEILEKGWKPEDPNAPMDPSLTTLGGHAVEIVGWGEGDARSNYGVVPYWIVKNSWGESFQDNGYFKIAMSTDGVLNANTGFDVPMLLDGQLFGGVTVIEPVISPDLQDEFKRPTKMQKKTISSLLIGVAVVIFILLLLLLI